MQERILIVEDEPTDLALLSSLLSNEGYEVLEAEDGEPGYQMAVDEEPDLIMLDIMMPGKDGFEVCTMLKSNETTHSIPVIFLTAKTDTVDKIQGLDRGAADYVTKPFEPAEVLARVRAQLRIRALERENLLQQRALWGTLRLAKELRAFAFVWPVVVLASFLWNMRFTELQALAGAHVLLWLVGLGMILWGDRRLKQSGEELAGVETQDGEAT